MKFTNAACLLFIGLNTYKSGVQGTDHNDGLVGTSPNEIVPIPTQAVMLSEAKRSTARLGSSSASPDQRHRNLIFYDPVCSTAWVGSCKCQPGMYQTSYISCFKCEAGTYNKDYGRWHNCLDCPKGSYQDGLAYNGCFSCKAGTYNPNTKSKYPSDCRKCPAGTYSGNRASECIKCPSPKVSSAGSSGCHYCDPGHRPKPGEESTSCEICPAGTEENGRRTCDDCQDGYFSLEGQIDCTRARAGYYAPKDGPNPKSKEYICPAGSYSTGGQTKCTPCDKGKSTFNVGSTSPDACIECKKGVDPLTFGCIPFDESNGLDVADAWGTSQSVAITPDGQISAVGGSEGDKGFVKVFQNGVEAFQIQHKHSKISTKNFGKSVAISANGKVVAVGQYGDQSAQGVVRIYQMALSSSTYEQIGHIAHDTPDFGASIALSHDGHTMVVGNPSAGDGQVSVYEFTGGEDPVGCGYSDIKQKDYRGKRSETKSGLRCQAWTAQEPHGHSRTPENYPEDGLVSNYCRNPDDSGVGAWCYTMQPGDDHRWETCGIPECNDNSWNVLWTYDGLSPKSKFGASVSISSYGSTIAVGAPSHADQGKTESGISFIFHRNADGTYTSVKHFGGDLANDQLGSMVSLSSDGTVLAASAPSAANDSKKKAGVVKFYKRTNDGNWSYKKQYGYNWDNHYFGKAMSLSPDGKRFAAGTTVAGGGNRGQAHVVDVNIDGDGFPNADTVWGYDDSNKKCGSAVALSNDDYWIMGCEESQQVALRKEVPSILRPLPAPYDQSSIQAKPVPAKVCWDEATIAGLNNSIAIEDLKRLMFDKHASLVSINGLVEETTKLLQDAASSSPSNSADDLFFHKQKLHNASKDWLESMTDGRLSKCHESLQGKVKTQYGAILERQFGGDAVDKQVEWITHWRCSGATFGCSGNSPQLCPHAKPCFEKIEKIFKPYLDHFALSNHGLSQTPIYSLEYLRKELARDVGQLVEFDSTQARMRAFEDVIKEVRENRQAIGKGFDATTSITAAGNAVALNTSIEEAKLYYKQIQHSRVVLAELAPTVRDGPKQDDKNLNELQEKCNQESMINFMLDMISAAFQIGSAIAGTAAGFAGAGNPLEIVEGIGELYETVDELIEMGRDLAEWAQREVPDWNPETDLPPLPKFNGDLLIDENWKKLSEWYIKAQSDLTPGLVHQGQASWQSMYLESKKNLEPFIEFPAEGCKNAAENMGKAVHSYLTVVKNMTNYGQAMTTAQANLVPKLGDIAAAMATAEAIKKASATLHASPFPILDEVLKSTVGSDLHSKVDDIVNDRKPEDTSTILSTSSALTLTTRMFESGKAIHSFCSSYRYMDAGEVYGDCQNFQNKYIPSYSDFQSIVNALSTKEYGKAKSTSDSVVERQKKFATQVQKQVWYKPKQLEAGLPLAEVQIYSNKSNQTQSTDEGLYLGSLQDGSIKFRLTPGSKLFKELTVKGANPRVVNVQAFWRGRKSKTRSYSYMPTQITVEGPHTVYEKKTGKASSYVLPAFQKPFAASFNAEKRSGRSCNGNTQAGDVTWGDDGHKMSYCTTQRRDFTAPVKGLDEYAFVFPSLYAEWKINVMRKYWRSGRFETNLDDLALSVQFTYVSSREESMKSDRPGNRCSYDCEAKLGLDPQSMAASTPLTSGELFCTGTNTCGECAVRNVTKKGDAQKFCMCNAWTGEATPCQTWNGTSTKSSGSSQRQLRGRHLQSITTAPVNEQATDDLVAETEDDGYVPPQQFTPEPNDLDLTLDVDYMFDDNNVMEEMDGFEEFMGAWLEDVDLFLPEGGEDVNFTFPNGPYNLTAPDSDSLEDTEAPTMGIDGEAEVEGGEENN